MKKKDSKKLSIEVDANEHRVFKSDCAAHGTTMQDRIVAFIKSENQKSIRKKVAS